MTQNDTLATTLSQIMNYERLGKRETMVKANSALIRTVLTLLQNERYIGAFEIVPDGKTGILKINLLGNINKIGVIKPRFSVSMAEYEKFEKRYLPAKDFGVLIVSTSKGMMTHLEAKKMHLGGKLISYCY
ncbi:30S ribosomal protein S8 [Candidatus Woesearchaeota archaeon]|nr:MAG: 30S ribosomal protein S8 [Candidatus Woesearchaeota archaeon]